MDLEVDQNGCVSGAHARGNSSSYAMAQYDFLRLIEAPATYSVYFVDYGGFGSGFDPSNRRIAIDASAPHTITYAAYDPSTHTCTAPGEVETYAEIIAHELGHAYMSARGARPAPPWLGAPSGEEYVANAYQNMYLSGHKRNARCRY